MLKSLKICSGLLIISFFFFTKTALDSKILPAKNISLAFVGDIMLDRGVKNSVYKNFGGDYSQLFFKIKEQLNSYDFLFGNLEGPISNRGVDGGNIYSFRFEPKVAPILREVGFDVFSVANNHIFNWGEDAFEDTLRHLTGAGIKYVGGGFTASEAYNASLFDVSGVKIAVLGFSEFPAPNLVIVSEDTVRNSVLKANLDNDLVIASFHFGEEYQKQPNDYQKKYAELAVDSGADLIIGHHPHVVQTLEKYKNSYIIYSLGNFIFDQYFSEDTMSGGLLDISVNPNNKKIEKVSLKKVSLNKMFQVESITSPTRPSDVNASDQ
jgi:poly-gamma-glutamate synthesis protein (capsule biosynthesis protein)